MAAKKRRSGRGKGPRQGISGNPQRRAEQLAQRLDSRSGNQDSPLWEMAYAMAGGAEPSPWWGESHHRILAAARALTWPSRLVDLETQACQIVGDEFYERLNSESAGLHASQWLRALAEETGAELRASVAGGTPVPAVNVSRPRERRSQARTTSGPAGVPASRVSTAWLASTTAGR